MYHVIYLIKQNGRTVGARVARGSEMFNMSMSDMLLNWHNLDNVRVVDYGEVYSIGGDLPIREVGVLTLYHGSPKETMRLVVNRNHGFYLTRNFELASELSVCRGNSVGFVHKFELYTTGLKILDLNDLGFLTWFAELMKNRPADTSARYRRLSVEFIEKFGIDTAGYDAIYGWRADSSYFSIAKRFVRDEIDYDLISELFHLGGLENQFCVKSRKAFNSLNEIGSPLQVGSEYKAKYDNRDMNARKKMNEIIESNRNTMTRGFTYVLRGGSL